jgi:hypothetical protein
MTGDSCKSYVIDDVREWSDGVSGGGGRGPGSGTMQHTERRGPIPSKLNELLSVLSGEVQGPSNVKQLRWAAGSDDE